MDLKKIVNQPTQQTSTKTGLVLPKVRYHPSIQSCQHRTVGQTHEIRTQIKTTGVQKTEADSTDQGTRPGRVQRSGRVQKTQADGTNQGATPGRVQRSGRVQKTQADGTNQGTTPGQVQRPGSSGVGLQAPLDPSVVKQVEVLTRGQRTNPDWFAWRKNRITASVAHCIAHSHFANGRSQTPPPSYLAAITGEGPTVQTRAMSWGVQMEAEAVRRYQELKTAALGRPVRVQDCGLFIDPRRSWLAASPDGIVTDDGDGRWRLCLEVKCPYKHRDRRVEDACRVDPAFCLQLQDQVQDQDQEQDQVQDGRRPREVSQPPVYQLKRTHSYFTQVQVQLAVTGLQQADLVVFTLKETAVVPVTFDPELWEETVSKLETFYRNAVLPLTGTAGAACRPEL